MAKIRHYRNLYLNRPDPIAFIPLAVDTTGRMYDEFIRILFFHAHCEGSFWIMNCQRNRTSFDSFTNLKGVVGLIMTKSSDIRISIHVDLSSRSFVPLPCFLLSRTDVSCQVRWRWRMTTDVSLTSGLTRTVFLIFFMVGVHFFWKINRKKQFFLWKQGHSETEEARYMTTAHRWWDSQSKQTRQTYRQSIQSTLRQFTKRWRRITTPRLHSTKELRNIRVKLNWEDHMWNLFITTINQYYVHTSCYMSLQSCMWGTKTNALIHIRICWGDIYGYIYIHLYTYIHTHTHTHTYC